MMSLTYKLDRFNIFSCALKRSSLQNTDQIEPKRLGFLIKIKAVTM